MASRHSRLPALDLAPDARSRESCAMADIREAERKSVDALLRRRFPDSCVACALQRKSCSSGATALSRSSPQALAPRSCARATTGPTPSTAHQSALNYARAAAVVKSLEWSVAGRAHRGLLETQARLKREPFMGELRGRWRTSWRRPAAASRSNGARPAPGGPQRQFHIVGEGGCSMRHADAKLALEGGRAADDGGDRVRRGRAPRRRQDGARHPHDRRAARRRQARRVAAPAVRAEAGEWRVHRRQARARALDELQLPVSADEARACLEAVQFEVRRQHSLRVGAKCDCPPPPRGAPRCTCCWHAELVGGARTRGRAGHDVDILLWHATEAASRGCTSRDYVIHDLARGLLVPGDDGGWKTNGGLQHPATRRGGCCGRTRAFSASSESTAPRGGPSQRRVEGARDAAPREELQGDWYDKLFGFCSSRAAASTAWTSSSSPAGGGSFARLTWTGSRTFNRLTRLRAIHLGLDLGPHGFTAKRRHLVVARREPPLTVTLPALGVVPYEFMQSEEDILRVLARGTDEFAALYDPRNRNA